MVYGQELIKRLQKDMECTQANIDDRARRIRDGWTDEDDCFVSIKCDNRQMQLCRDKIRLIEEGGTSWFTEYATLDGTLVDAHWCNTRYGSRLKVNMPDGKVIWTSAGTKKGLAKLGLKLVRCKRPAWFAFRSPVGGMCGVYMGSYVLFPSDVNYATGEEATSEPLEMEDID